MAAGRHLEFWQTLPNFDQAPKLELNLMVIGTQINRDNPLNPKWILGPMADPGLTLSKTPVYASLAK